MVLFVLLFSFCDLDKWKSSNDRFDDFEAWSEFYSDCENVESISESDQLHTYPSPDPTLALTCYYMIVVELGEGQVCSFSDTDIDSKCLTSLWR